jgi:flagellar hook-basal body complex protein FliE
MSVMTEATSANYSFSTLGQKGNVTLEMQPSTAADSGEFRTALERYLKNDPIQAKADNASLGSAIVGRTTHLAAEIKQDQQYVSKLLEQATRTGDSMQLMKAMMALNDFQLRVQTVSKVVSKAVTSVDSLTKLQ